MKSYWPEIFINILHHAQLTIDTCIALDAPLTICCECGKAATRVTLHIYAVRVEKSYEWWEGAATQNSQLVAICKQRAEGGNVTAGSHSETQRNLFIFGRSTTPEK